MSEKWYYVLAGERQGPVDFEVVNELYNSGDLKADDYVWCKGFENWVKLKDVDAFQDTVSPAIPTPEPVAQKEVEVPEPINQSVDLSHYELDNKCFYIKVGADRGGAETEYGPFSIEILKKLYTENRINAKTFIFTKGIGNWLVLGDIQGFEEVFEEVPPMIDESDKRAFKRKPFIARMFIQNNKEVFEGICRDVSIGGMQVLVDNCPINVGERISINVHPENTEHHFVASGDIVRVLEGGQGFSFRFQHLKEDALGAINAYISQE